MNLAQALRFLPAPTRPPAALPHFPLENGGGQGRGGGRYLALVGAGGKTTALFQLARALPPPVIVSATTHLHVDQTRLADAHWIGASPADLAGLEENLSGVVLVTGPVEGDRTTGLNESTIEWLHAICESHSLPLLIEADGSRRRPLKAPAEHEPPIPDFVETVGIVAGLSGLGKPLTEEFVHRPEIFARLSGLAPGENVTPEALARLLTHPKGGLKNISAQARRVALLNQADTPELQSIGGKMAQELLGAFDAVVVGTLEPTRLQTVERTAGIILAAGESSRFGRPKQLLEYRGQPFVRNVVQAALSAGLSPVIVVTGANAEAVEAAIRDLPVTIVRNPEWQKGQSSSIRAGLKNLTHPLPAFGHPPLLSPREAPPKGVRREKGRDGVGLREVGCRGVGSVLFLLADQPQVPPTLLRALVERHSLDLSPIVAPQVAGRRANPVLFDRVTFPELLSLEGDVGGRAIFSKFPLTYLPWHDESLLLDIDTENDYRKLKGQ